MNKKVWSIVLLFVMTALLIALCWVGMETRDAWIAWKESVSSENISGISFFAGMMGILSFGLGSMIAIFFISFGGLLFSLLNICIATNKAIKYVSVGFLIVYAIPAFMIAIGFLSALFFL